MKKYKGYEYLVLQMPMGYLCGSVKVPENHPCYGKDYADISIDCHGGLTFGIFNGKDSDIRIHKEYDFSKYFGVGFWIGWDYAHLGDKTFYMIGKGDSDYERGKLWQPFEVEEECKNVINQLIALSKEE